MKKRVLVLPAGTEIAHEIFESLKFSKHWTLVGANGALDHSEVTFPILKLGLPHVDHCDFAAAVADLVKQLDIDIVVPAHDEAAYRLTGLLSEVVFAGPRPDLAATLRYKSLTLAALQDVVPTPRVVNGPVYDFPVFAKPDRGQGSRGARRVDSAAALAAALAGPEPMLVQEWLSGTEATVDCFSLPDFSVIYAKGRERLRTSGGIATRTRLMPSAEFFALASKISRRLKIKGAWFFQVKQDRDGVFRLLEVANRIAGSSGVQRALGVNLMDAWLHQLTGASVVLPEPVSAEVSYDRALYARMRVSITLERVYVDFDDTLVLPDGRLNYRLIGILFGLKNDRRIAISLITRHDGEIEWRLESLGLSGLFDDVIHLQNREEKSSRIAPGFALLIDDSFRERDEVARNTGILCLPPESLEFLEGMLHPGLEKN